MIAGYANGRDLTPRMRQALEGAARGETTRQTATRLGIAEATVKTIRAAARDRLGARSTGQAYAIARDRGLL